MIDVTSPEAAEFAAAFGVTLPTQEQYEARVAAFADQVPTPLGPMPSADADAYMAALISVRESLTDAVQLAALSPYPTPEEQAIIDAQVSASLGLFRALADPPADVTALAAAVLTLEVAR